MRFSRQEYWSGLPFPSPGDFPDPGIEPVSPASQADSLPSEPLGFVIKPEWIPQSCVLSHTESHSAVHLCLGQECQTLDSSAPRLCALSLCPQRWPWPALCGPWHHGWGWVVVSCWQPQLRGTGVQAVMLESQLNSSFQPLSDHFG